MIQYVKARLYNKTTWALKGNCLIVKQIRNNKANWFAVAKNDLLAIGERIFESFVIDPDCVIEATDGVRGTTLAIETPMVDSFQTLLISQRMNIDSVLYSFRVSISEEIYNVNEVFSTLNLDDIFAIEQREEFSMSGLLIKTAYTQNSIYSGYGGYHSNQRSHTFNTPVQNDKPWRIGVELECYARTEAAFNKITSARTNWFQCERDGSLDEHDYPIEIKTIPLRACDAKSVDFWSEPMRKLGELAVSKGYRSTGLHVHISKEILGENERERQNNLNKLCTFYTYYIEDDPSAHQKNVIICGRERGYSGQLESTKTSLSEFAKKVGINRVGENAEAFNEMAEGIKSGYNNQRWDINLRNWNTYGTIEFRKGDGRISKTRLAAMCTWWEQLCIYCKETHPKDFSFNNFFEKVCRENPCVAFFFQQDDEC